MKKLFVLFILFAVIASVSLCAWEPNDLTKYPSCMKAENWLLNFGVGFHGLLYYGENYIFFPPIHVSLDKNVPLGDKGLPFFFGGTVGYWGYGYKGLYYNSNLTIAARFGYHFNWGIDKLDTYAVVRAGYSFYLGNKDNLPAFNLFDRLQIGLNVGARYFLTDWFGFWAEGGIGSYYSVDIGLAFKF